ncbi:Ig-like domain-containing protein [Limnohabitans sp.]|uniref:Ig-like domain-containing protein n=1 Tax=Limnohabitans sp. TaxID=1907725 RepID=UPI00286F5F5C|nr:Ig-like domain-containing protein [Limnohabitans sp.]
MILDGSAVLGTAKVSGTSWTFTTPALSVGSHSLTAAVQDLAGNFGAASGAHRVRLENTALSLSSVEDTGISSTDHLTNNAAVKVTGLSKEASFQFQIDGGTWQAGSLNQFNLIEGKHSYAIREVDASGHIGMVSKSVTYALDTSSPTGVPMLRQVPSTSANASDQINTPSRAHVTGVELGNTWQYSTNNGTTWINGNTLPVRPSLDSLNVRNISATLNGGSIGTDLKAYAVGLSNSNTDTSVKRTVWLVSYDGTYTKGVQCEISVNADGQLTAKGISAAYKQGDFTTNWMDQVVNKTVTTHPFATGEGVTGYGAKSLSVDGLRFGSGYLSDTTSAVLPEAYALDLRSGAHNYLVRQVDAAGNAGPASASTSLTGIASYHQLTLSRDTGSSADDCVTSDGRVKVSELTGTIQYSTDAGATWQQVALGLGDMTEDMITGTLNGSWIGRNMEAKAVGLRGDSSSKSVWLVAYDGTYTKGVKVEFRQASGGIVATALEAAYIEGNYVAGFADLSQSQVRTAPYAEDDSSQGYGVKSLQLKGVDLISGIFHATYISQTHPTSAVSIPYDRSKSFALPEGTYEPGQVQVKAVSSVLKVKELTSDMISGTLNGLWVGSDVQAQVVGLRGDSSSKSVWLVAYDGTYTNGVKVEFRQNGNRIVTEATEARYIRGDYVDGFADLSPSQCTSAPVADHYSSPGYGVRFLQLLNGTYAISGYRSQSVQIERPSETYVNDKLWTVDKTVLAPTIGSIGTDDNIPVSGLEPGATWKYRVDGGAWQDGKGFNFKASLGSHTYEVYQTDVAGSSSSYASSAGSVSSRNTPILLQDTGTSSADGVTSNGLVTFSFQPLVSGAFHVNDWQYSTTGGRSWTAGETIFRLKDLKPELIKATLNGGSIGFDAKATVVGWGTYPDGFSANCWLVFYDGTYTKGVRVEFINAAGEVYATVLGAAYARGNHVTDWQTTSKETTNVAKNSAESGYGVKSLQFQGISFGDGYLQEPTWDEHRYPASIAVAILGGSKNFTPLNRAFVLPEGTYEAGQVVIARKPDGSGNVEVLSTNNRTWTIDHSVETPKLSIDRDKPDQIQVEGLEAGGLWDYKVDDGNWTRGTGSSFDVHLGTHTYTVRQSDLAGNSSNSTASVRHTASLPVPKLDLISEPGVSIKDGVTQHDKLSINGVISGAKTQWRVDGDPWKDMPNDLRLIDGKHTYQVRQISSDGQVSEASDSVTYTLDTQAPIRPSMVLHLDSGNDKRDGLTNTARVKIEGLEAGATWQYQVDDGAWQTGGTTLEGAGFDLTQGSHRYAVRQTDVAGNVGTASQAATYTLDTSAPNAPTLTLSPVSQGAVRVIQVGGLGADASWKYQVDGGTAWTAGTGNSLALDAGTHTYTLQQWDKAGNSSSTSSLTVNQSSLQVRLREDTGFSAQDGYTRTPTVLVSGDTKSQGALLQYRIDGGDWRDVGSTSSFKLVEGSHNYEVREVSLAGVLASSDTMRFTLDTTAPSPLVLTLAPETHDVAGTGYSKQGRINVLGLETNCTWEYRVDGGQWAQGAGDSFWGTPGKHFYEVRARDASGNVSAAPNLLRNGDFAEGTNSFTSDYLQQSSPADAGTYAVVSVLPNWGLAHASIKGGEGQFLIAKGASDANKLVWSQQVELKAGELYDFNASALVNAGADLQLTVNGEDVGNAFKPQTSLDWQHWGTRFLSTTTGTVKLGVRSKGADTKDNNLALDTLSLERVMGIEVNTQAVELKLSSDTGRDATDGVTSNASILVEGLTSGQAWQWRADGGTWQTGSGNSFQALAGKHSYEARGEFSGGFGASSNKLDVRYDNQAPNSFDTKALHIASTPGGASKASASVAISSDDGACVTFWAHGLEATKTTTQLLSTNGTLGGLYFLDGKLVYEVGGIKRYASANGQGTDQASEASVSMDTLWHHYALNIDSNGGVSIYQDAEQIMATNLPNHDAFSNANLTFGGHATLNNRGWGGDFLNIQVWDKAMSLVQIIQASEPILEPSNASADLKAYWPDGQAALASTPNLSLSGQAGQAELFKVLTLQTTAKAVNLLSNGEFDSATDFLSDYQKVNSVTDTGRVAIINEAPAWGIGVTKGHGNGGKFLFADGAADATKKVWFQTVRLEAGTSYDFSGFVAANNGAVLQLTVNGVDVGDAFSPVAGADWQAWKASFTSTVSGEVTMGIRDKSTAAAANDFALDSLALYRKGDGWGASALTTDGGILVNGVTADTQWQWRMDSGEWSAGDSKTSQIQASSGKHSYQVRLVDTAGNVGAASQVFTVDYDITRPELGVTQAVSVAEATHTDNYTVGGQTFSDTIKSGLFDKISSTWTLAVDKPVTLGGQYSAGDVVQVFFNGADKPLATTTANSQGNWTLTLLPDAMENIPLGRSRIDVRITDAAGNLSSSLDSFVLVRTPQLDQLTSRAQSLPDTQATPSPAVVKTVFLEQFENNDAAATHGLAVSGLGIDPGAPPSGDKILLRRGDNSSIWSKMAYNIPEGVTLQFSFMLCIGNAQQDQLPQVGLWINGARMGDVTVLPQGSKWTKVTVNFVKNDNAPLGMELKNEVTAGTNVYLGVDDIRLSYTENNSPVAPTTNLLSAGSFELGSAKLKTKGFDNAVSLLPEGTVNISRGEATSVSSAPTNWKLGSTAARGDARFLAVHSKGGGQVVWSETLTEQSGATLSLSYWVNTGEGSAPLLRLKANGQVVSDVMTSTIAASQGWTQIQVTFTAPDSKVPLQLSLEDMSSSGARFGLDDLNLRVISAPPASTDLTDGTTESSSTASNATPTTPSAISTSPPPQEQSNASTLSGLLTSLQTARTDSDVLNAMRQYLTNYNDFELPASPSNKPYVGQIVDQLIDDRWRHVSRTILKDKFSANYTGSAESYLALMSKNPGAGVLTIRDLAVADARSKFLGVTGRLLGTAWNQATAQTLGAQISNFKLTGDSNADTQAQLNLAASAMFELARLTIFLTVGDSYLTKFIANHSTYTVKDISKLTNTTGLALNGFIRAFMLGQTGMAFDKAVHMPPGNDRDLAIARSTFDVLSGVAGTVANFGFAFDSWDTGGRATLAHFKTQNALSKITPYSGHFNFAPEVAEAQKKYITNLKGTFEENMSFGKQSAATLDKATAIIGALQTIFSIVSLATYFGDKTLTNSQKAALGATIGLDVVSAVGGSLATLALQRAIATEASAMKIGGLSAVAALMTFIAYLNPMQIEQMTGLFNNARKVQDFANDNGRGELGYSGDQLLADLTWAQANMEAGMMGAQLGLAVVAATASVVGGPVGWVVSAVSSIISMVIEAIRQPILEGVAAEKRQEMLNESHGDLNAYFVKGLQATFAKMLKDPEVISYFKDQLKAGDFDKAIGLISINPDSAMHSVAAITKTAEFLPQWKLFTAEINKSQALSDSTAQRVDQTHTRIDVSSPANNQKIFLATPLFPYGTSTSERINIAGEAYRTQLNNIKQSGWTINDGESNSVIDLGNVVTIHLGAKGAAGSLDKIDEHFLKLVRDWWSSGAPFYESNPIISDGTKRAIKELYLYSPSDLENILKSQTDIWIADVYRSGDIQRYFENFFGALNPWDTRNTTIADKYRLPMPDINSGPGNLRVVTYDSPGFFMIHQSYGETGGKFLMADGHTTPGKAVWGQDIYLVAGQRYDFSAWVLTTTRPSELGIPPIQLQLKVNGVNVGQSYTTKEYQWWAWDTEFVSTVTGPARVSLHDINTNGAANDFGLDNLSLRGYSTNDDLLVSGNFFESTPFLTDYRNGSLDDGRGVSKRAVGPTNWPLGFTSPIDGDYLIASASSDVKQSVWYEMVELKAGQSYRFDASVQGRGDLELQLTLNGEDVGSSYKPSSGAVWEKWAMNLTSDVTGKVKLGVRNKNPGTSDSPSFFALDQLSLHKNLIANGGFDDRGGFETDYTAEVKLSTLELAQDINFTVLTQVNAGGGDDAVITGIGQYIINGGAGHNLVDYSSNSDEKTSLTFKYTGNQITVEKRNQIGTVYASALSTSTTSYGKRSEAIEYVDLKKIDDVRIDSQTLIDHLSNVDLVKGSRGKDYFYGDAGDQYFACNDLKDFFSGGGGTDVVDMHQVTGTEINLSNLADHFKDIDLVVLGDTNFIRTTLLGGDGNGTPRFTYGGGRDIIDASKLTNAGIHVQKVANTAISGTEFKGSKFADIVDYDVTIASQTFSEFKVDTGEGNDVVSFGWRGGYAGNSFAQETVIQLGAGNDTLYLNVNLSVDGNAAKQVIYAEGGKGQDMLFIAGNQGILYDDSFNPDMLSVGVSDLYFDGFEIIRGTDNNDVFLMSNGKTNMARYFFGSGGNDVYVGSTKAIETLDYSLADKGLFITVISGNKTDSTEENACIGMSRMTMSNPLQKVGLVNVDAFIGTTYDDTIFGGGGGEHYTLGLGNDTFSAAITGASSASLGDGNDTAFFVGGSLLLKGDAGRDIFNQNNSVGLSASKLEALQQKESKVTIEADGGDTINLAASNFCQTIIIDNEGLDWGSVDVNFTDGGALFNQFLWVKDSDQQKLVGLWSPSDSDESVKTTYLKALEFSLNQSSVMLHFADGEKSTAEIAKIAYEDKNLMEVKTLQNLDGKYRQLWQSDDSSRELLGYGEDYLLRMLATKDQILSQVAHGAVL